MNPPKIEICIEGYNIDQTDFYISHILDKYNSLNELYKKSCEHIVFLEKECKEGFLAALSESEQRIAEKISAFESRLNDIEKAIEMNASEATAVINNDCENNNRFKNEISDFHSELEDIKSLFIK